MEEIINEVETTAAPEVENTDWKAIANEAYELAKKFQDQYNTEHNSYLRALADYQNYKRYADEKIASSRNDGKLSAIKDLLDIVDTFEMAISKDNSEGITNIYNMLVKYLASQNVTKVDIKVGDAFNDEYCNGIGTVPTNVAEENNQIVFIMKPAYKFADKIIRYAQVMVKQYSE